MDLDKLVISIGLKIDLSDPDNGGNPTIEVFNTEVGQDFAGLAPSEFNFKTVSRLSLNGNSSSKFYGSDGELIGSINSNTNQESAFAVLAKMSESWTGDPHSTFGSFVLRKLTQTAEILCRAKELSNLTGVPFKTVANKLMEDDESIGGAVYGASDANAPAEYLHGYPTKNGDD